MEKLPSVEGDEKDVSRSTTSSSKKEKVTTVELKLKQQTHQEDAKSDGKPVSASMQGLLTTRV